MRRPLRLSALLILLIPSLSASLGAQEVRTSALTFTKGGGMVPGSGESRSRKRAVVKYQVVADNEGFAGYRFESHPLASLVKGDSIILFLLDARGTPGTGNAVRTPRLRGAWVEISVAAAARDGGKVILELASELSLWSGLTLKRVEFAAEGDYASQIPPAFAPTTVVDALRARIQNAALPLAERRDAVQDLGWMAGHSREALVALSEVLRDPVPEVAAAAADGLRELGPAARETAPALVEALQHQDRRVRERGATALGFIDADPGTVIPALTAALRDPDAAVLLAAVRPLLRMKAPIVEAVPGLIQALPTHRHEVPTLLGLIGPPAVAAVPSLREALKDKEPSVRGFAAEALWKIDPATAPECVPVLVSMLSGTTNVAIAATALGNMGPAARDAIPALTRLSGERRAGPDVNRAAGEALRKIQGQ